MPEPSLTELASAGQSMEAVPTIAVNNQQEMVRTLNQQAQFKAQNDWNKYLNFQKNLGDFYANVAEVEKLEVMDEDKEALQKDVIDVYKMALNNPDAFSRNPQKFGELQSMYGAVLAKATESKQNNLFDKANRAYVAQNNELNNDDNKAVIDQYRNQPLGSRKAYSLNLTPVFDANSFAEGLKSKLLQTKKEPSLIGGLDEKGNATPGDAYIRDTTTETIPYQQFKTQWNNAYGFQDDKNGQPIRKWADQQYQTLPEDVKKKISPEQFWDKVGDNFFGSTKDEQGNIKDIIKKTEGEIKANPNYLKQQTIDQQERDLQERRRHNKVSESQGWAKIDAGNEEDSDQAQGAVVEIQDIIRNATRPENLKFVVDPKGNRQQMGTVSDPNIIKQYTTIDKDGKTTNPPDDVLLDRTSGQMSIVYYKKDDEGNIVKSPQGAAIMERSVPLNTTTWVHSVVNRNENAKNKGKISKSVLGFYDKKGGVFKGAREINQQRDKEEAAQNNNTPAASSAETFIVNGQVYTKEELGWTDEQIQKALGSGKIKKQ